MTGRTFFFTKKKKGDKSADSGPHLNLFGQLSSACQAHQLRIPRARTRSSGDQIADPHHTRRCLNRACAFEAEELLLSRMERPIRPCLATSGCRRRGRTISGGWFVLDLSGSGKEKSKGLEPEFFLVGRDSPPPPPTPKSTAVRWSWLGTCGLRPAPSWWLLWGRSETAGRIWWDNSRGYWPQFSCPANEGNFIAFDGEMISPTTASSWWPLGPRKRASLCSINRGLGRKSPPLRTKKLKKPFKRIKWQPGRPRHLGLEGPPLWSRTPCPPREGQNVMFICLMRGTRRLGAPLSLQLPSLGSQAQKKDD